MRYLMQFNRYLNYMLLVIGGASLVFLTGLAAANMLLRLVYVPLQGTYELIGFCAAVVAAFGFSYTQIRKDHIIVDIITNKFSREINTLLDKVNYLVSTTFFGIVAWQAYLYGMKILATGELSETLKIVFHPFILAVSFGFACLSLTLFIDFLRALLEPPKERDV
jgi:TRAP-type C4-dicarboxylate transport system permease small subunit